MWEWGAAELADAAELVASELVTNSVNDCVGLDQAAIRLVLTLDRGELAILVRDDHPGVPMAAQPGADDESGRGLLIVEHLSDRCGWHPLEDAKRCGQRPGEHAELDRRRLRSGVKPTQRLPGGSAHDPLPASPQRPGRVLAGLEEPDGVRDREPVAVRPVPDLLRRARLQALSGQPLLHGPQVQPVQPVDKDPGQLVIVENRLIGLAAASEITGHSDPCRENQAKVLQAPTVVVPQVVDVVQ